MSLFTYHYNGLVTKLAPFVSPFLSFIETEYSEGFFNLTRPVFHDASFSPDFILNVTEKPFTQSCISKPAVILINGTSPGPEIRLAEGKIYWIRVFNDMDNQNLTMVTDIPV